MNHSASFKAEKTHINELDFWQNLKNPILGVISGFLVQKQISRPFQDNSTNSADPIVSKSVPVSIAL